VAEEPSPLAALTNTVEFKQLQLYVANQKYSKALALIHTF
jgi:hypothetical protein